MKGRFKLTEPLKSARVFGIAVLLAVPGLASAPAETLPLSNGLISLDSEQGETLFFKAEANKAYFPLGLHFVTQDNPAFCGPASIAMVLNALHLPRPRRAAVGHDARLTRAWAHVSTLPSTMRVKVVSRSSASLPSANSEGTLASFLSITFDRASVRAPWDIFRLLPLTTETATGSLFSMYRATNTRQSG